MALKSINPATGRLIETYEELEPAQVDDILVAVAEGQRQWRRTGFAERAACLERVAKGLRARADALAKLMTEEMGKPIAQGRAEVEKCAWVCEYYAEHAEAFLADQSVATDAARSFVAHEPLGVVLAVMPWNFPLWQVFRFAAPGLMAGNCGVLKHASNVTGSALAIERLFREAEPPVEVFRTLPIGSPRVGAVIEHPAVRAVTLTGSTEAGRKVAAAAGRAIKKTVLELGGSDAYVVLEDADVEHAARTCAASRLINTGQSCIAAKRFIVHEAVYEAFLEQFVERMRAARVGDPMDDATEVGPMARADLRDELHAQVEASVAGGARLALGGEIPDGEGAFYPPSVLVDVGPGMPAFDDELFGPVASVIKAASEADAVRLANQSPFGLGAAVFTRDRERGERIAKSELEAGCCFVNDFVKSDPRVPFGGVKESGYGRELGRLGIGEFVNAKTVWVA